MNTRLSGNNLEALIAYKNKLKEVKDKELVNKFIFIFLHCLLHYILSKNR